MILADIGNSLTGQQRQFLIAIIGIDGAGKSTQIAAVHNELMRCGHQVTRLPNEGLEPLWERLDDISAPTGNDVEEYFGTDTIQLVASAIKWFGLMRGRKALDDSRGVVLADRYSYCQMAAAQRTGDRVRRAIEHLYHDVPAPDVCIWLDVPPEDAIGRLGLRGDRFATLAFLKTHREGYARLAAEHDFIVVDGSPPSDEVTSSIMQTLRGVLPELFGDVALA